MLRPELQPTLRTLQSCRVCLQYRDEDEAKRAAVEVALFGRGAYAVCPSCGQKADDAHDRNYRRRVRRFLTSRRRHGR